MGRLDFRIRCKLQRISPENCDKIERRKDWVEGETLNDVVCRKVNVGGSVSESRGVGSVRYGRSGSGLGTLDRLHGGQQTKG